MTDTQIQLKDITRIYQVGGEQVYALNKVTLDIAAGDYISIMGPSGSGKSTLLNMIGLLDRADSGSYLLENRDVTALTEEELAEIRQQTLGFVFQAFHLIPRMSAAENIELPMTLAGIPAMERKPRVTQALANTGLANRANHRPDQLSGGQRQRVAIARATIMQPKILLADEPTGNLDSKSGEEVIKVLEDLNQQGITLIIVTHDIKLGNRARRQIKMIDGTIHTVLDNSGNHASH